MERSHVVVRDVFYCAFYACGSVRRPLPASIYMEMDM